MIYQFLVGITLTIFLFYLINLSVWAFVTRSFKPSFFYLALLYTTTVVTTIIIWEFIKIGIFILLYRFAIKAPTDFTVAAVIVSILDLIVWVCAYFIFPQKILKWFASRLVSQREIQNAIIMQIIILFVLMLINLLMKSMMQIEMTDYLGMNLAQSQSPTS